MRARVEDHQQYPQMLDWIAKGADAATIARRLQPPLHRSTIWRFIQDRVKSDTRRQTDVVTTLASKGLLREGITESQVAEVAKIATVGALSLAADPIRSRLLKHQQTVDACIQDATAAKDGRTVASLIGADLRGIELDARLTGRLNTDANQITVNIVVPMSAQPVTEPQDFEVIDIKPIER